MSWFNRKELAEIERLKGIIATLEAGKVENDDSRVTYELFKIRSSHTQNFYENKPKPFFSKYEQTLFEMLQTIVTSEKFKQELNGRYFVFPKVRMSDIIKVKREKWDAYEKGFKGIDKNSVIVDAIEKLEPSFDHKKYVELIINPIHRTHIDFLICFAKNDDVIAPVMAIELHGKEHGKKQGKVDKNDILKEKIFKQFDVKNKFLWVIENEELNKDDFMEILKKELIERLERLSLNL